MKPISGRRRMKFLLNRLKTIEEREKLIRDAVRLYSDYLDCIYSNEVDERPSFSSSSMELFADELFQLNVKI